MKLNSKIHQNLWKFIITIKRGIWWKKRNIANHLMHFFQWKLLLGIVCYFFSLCNLLFILFLCNNTYNEKMSLIIQSLLLSEYCNKSKILLTCNLLLEGRPTAKLWWILMQTKKFSKLFLNVFDCIFANLQLDYKWKRYL